MAQQIGSGGAARTAYERFLDAARFNNPFNSFYTVPWNTGKKIGEGINQTKETFQAVAQGGSYIALGIGVLIIAIVINLFKK